MKTLREARCLNGWTYVLLDDAGEYLYFTDTPNIPTDPTRCFRLYAPVTDDARIDAHFANQTRRLGGLLEPTSVWANQGRRRAECLARIGTKALVEYEMPAGRTFLAELDLTRPMHYGEGYRSISYRAVPMYWLKAMRDDVLDAITDEARKVTPGKQGSPYRTA